MAATKFHFGLFEFDTESLALSRDGRPIRLQSQPAQVLALLVANAERVVSRDEMKNAIWGDDTFVDFERGLNFCIAQIRSALQDTAANPLYIRTFPKSGYRFVAPVQSSVQPSSADAAAPGPVLSPPSAAQKALTPRRGLWLFAIVAGLMVLALLGALIVSILELIARRHGLR
jgi:DNA-binding winged helix-turn-helix (wHTH) protein